MAAEPDLPSDWLPSSTVPIAIRSLHLSKLPSVISLQSPCLIPKIVSDWTSLSLGTFLAFSLDGTIFVGQLHNVVNTSEAIIHWLQSDLGDYTEIVPADEEEKVLIYSSPGEYLTDLLDSEKVPDLIQAFWANEHEALKSAIPLALQRTPLSAWEKASLPPFGISSLAESLKSDEKEHAAAAETIRLELTTILKNVAADTKSRLEHKRAYSSATSNVCKLAKCLSTILQPPNPQGNSWDGNSQALYDIICEQKEIIADLTKRVNILELQKIAVDKKRSDARKNARSFPYLHDLPGRGTIKKLSIKVPGDGHCAFHTMGLIKRQAKSVKKFLTPDPKHFLASSARENTVTHGLTKFVDAPEDFIQYMAESYPDIKENGLEVWADDMLGSTHGGYAEFKLFSEANDIEIRIHNQTGGTLSTWPEENKELHPVAHVIRSESKNNGLTFEHYDLLGLRRSRPTADAKDRPVQYVFNSDDNEAEELLSTASSPPSTIFENVRQKLRENKVNKEKAAAEILSRLKKSKRPHEKVDLTSEEEKSDFSPNSKDKIDILLDAQLKFFKQFQDFAKLKRLPSSERKSTKKQSNELKDQDLDTLVIFTDNQTNVIMKKLIKALPSLPKLISAKRTVRKGHRSQRLIITAKSTTHRKKLLKLIPKLEASGYRVKEFLPFAKRKSQAEE